MTFFLQFYVVYIVALHAFVETAKNPFGLTVLSQPEKLWTNASGVKVDHFEWLMIVYCIVGLFCGTLPQFL